MSLNIKRPEAHALAERLAKLTGETLTEAVTTALRSDWRGSSRNRTSTRPFTEKLKAIATDTRKHMKEPWLSMEHGDLLYDERGLPK